MTKALLALLMISSISATFADDAANPAPKSDQTEEAGQQAPAPNNNPQG